MQAAGKGTESAALAHETRDDQDGATEVCVCSDWHTMSFSARYLNATF